MPMIILFEKEEWLAHPDVNNREGRRFESSRPDEKESCQEIDGIFFFLKLKLMCHLDVSLQRDTS